jgi:Flp pilus assembly protein TadD
MGMAAHLSGDHLTAERMFSQALNDDPSNALAWYRYAIVLLDLGRDAEARRALDTAVKLDPGGDVGQLADRSLENLLTGFR